MSRNPRNPSAERDSPAQASPAQASPAERDSPLERIEIAELMALLPHRYPFLLVDRIVGVEGDERAVGIKNVTINEPFFEGHFPGNPVMPGVLILEAMAQTCGAVVGRRHARGKPKLVYLMTIDEAKFRHPVVPGDALEIRTEKLRCRKNVFRYACEAFCGEVKVAEAIVCAMMSDAEQEEKTQ